jgi:hypothetical protein
VLTTPLEEEATVSNDIREKQWVGVDLHLHRSVICRIDEQGKQLECVQIDNDPKALVKAVRPAGRGDAGRGGGDLRLVLGRRGAAGREVRGAPGASVRDEGDAQAQAGQDRRPRRL